MGCIIFRVEDDASHDQEIFMQRPIRNFIISQDGGTAAEYAIMASLIAVVIVTAVALLGTNTSSLFQSVSKAMSGKW